MAWFKKVRKPIEPQATTESRVPEGLWVKCPSCSEIIYNKDLAATLNVCPKCAHHFRIGAAERLRMLFDGEWQEYDADLQSTDPLKFTDTKPYRKRLDATIAATGMKDAVICATGRIEGIATLGRGDGIRLHRRQHGRGRRREDHPRHRARDRAAAAGRHRLLLGRRAHDGRGAVADADGEDQRRAGAARSGAAALRLGADRSDDRRRHGQLRDARRRQHRRTQGADRLRRPARHRADHPAEAARRVSSAASSCSSTACSTWSSTGAR